MAPFHARNKASFAENCAWASCCIPLVGAIARFGVYQVDPPPPGNPAFAKGFHGGVATGLMLLSLVGAACSIIARRSKADRRRLVRVIATLGFIGSASLFTLNGALLILVFTAD